MFFLTVHGTILLTHSPSLACTLLQQDLLPNILNYQPIELL
jgi:hypothetical protein